MLAARLKKARRLLDLSRSLQRLEEERIAALRRRQDELATLQDEALSALNDDGELHGLLLPVAVRRLQSLGDESKRIGIEVERRLHLLRTLATRTKVAERLSGGYEQQHARAEAEKELRDIIERLARPDDASLP